MSIIKLKRYTKIFVATAAILVSLSQTGAALADSFNQNNIIDDPLFTATTSMSQSDIQTFLTSQGGFLANWTDSLDVSSTFTFYNSDDTVASTGNVCKVHNHTNMTAAQIIYQAATGWNPQYINWPLTPDKKYITGCGTIVAGGQDTTLGSNTATVSPKVILTTLQKEQILVTATGSYSSNPSDYTNATYPSNEYAIDWAMGYGVPDSGGKDDAKMGFYNQVMYGAWQLRLNSECAIGHTVTSQWSGFDDYTGLCTRKWLVGQTISIDGTNVTLDDAATASLYSYTPHFSGNQHFFTIYEQWFGSVYVPAYHWSFNSQASYTDSTKATPMSLNGLSAGQTAWLVVKATNTGNTTWQQTGTNQVDLATDRSTGRSSRFATGAWLSPNTPAKMDESSVAPGGTATFEFPIQVPPGGGTFNEYFNPVVQNITYLNNDVGQYFGIGVGGSYSWQWQSQSSSTDLSNVAAGSSFTVTVHAKNTGTATWLNSSTYRASIVACQPTNGTISRTSSFFDSSWLSPTTPANVAESSVAPGQSGTFSFTMKAPNTPGTYNEYFNLLAQNITWMNANNGQYFPITVH
jgi:hypothetical protein